MGAASRMEKRLDFTILPQPNEWACGPTCLHALYRYYGDEQPLEEVVSEVPKLENGGTLAVYLGAHALRRGYRAHIYTYNLKLFDPTWFGPEKVDLRAKLAAELQAKPGRKLGVSIRAYLEFLDLGGHARFEDLTTRLLRRYLNRGVPILTGLSATYLYRTPRELDGETLEFDDVRGLATGHFVVLCGYDPEQRTVTVADPLLPNPVSKEQIYQVGIERLICAILLGILTYDGNLLIVTPGGGRSRPPRP
jgi:hypothetical protein